MIRVSDILLTGLMVAAAVWTYQIKYRAADSASEIVVLKKKIYLENARIDLLEADWSVLTQPRQLQSSVDRFSRELQLQQLGVAQIITLDELPKIVEPDDPIGALARRAGIDNLITGSIGAPRR